MMIRGLRSFFSVPAGVKGKIKFRISVLEDTTVTPETFVYQPYFNYELTKIDSKQDSIKRVVGKNLFDEIEASLITNYRYSGTWQYCPINLKPNTTYTISTIINGTIAADAGYNFQISTSTNKDDTIFYLNNSSHSGTIASEQLSFTTDNEGTIYLLTLYGNNDRFETFFNQVSIQIELGSVATTYEPYGSGIPYWYIYEEINKTTLNLLAWIYDGTIKRFYSNTLTDGITSPVNTRIKVLSNYFHFISSEVENGGIFYYYNGNNRQVYTYNESITVASDFQTWVATTLPKLYYYLGVPKYTLITDSTLINQLNNLYEAKSYDNVTNIIQENNDLPFILDITTLKKS